MSYMQGYLDCMMGRGNGLSDLMKQGREDSLAGNKPPDLEDVEEIYYYMQGWIDIVPESASDEDRALQSAKMRDYRHAA